MLLGIERNDKYQTAHRVIKVFAIWGVERRLGCYGITTDSWLDLFSRLARNRAIKPTIPAQHHLQTITPKENAPLLAVSGIAIAALLGHAIWLNNGAFHPTALSLIGLSIVIAFAATISSSFPSIRVSENMVHLVLWSSLGAQFIQLQLMPPGVFIEASNQSWHLFSALLASATFLAGGSLSKSKHIGLTCFALSLVAFICLAWWVLHFAPNPRIDVFEFQRRASDALLSRTNPYTIRTPNIYGHSHFYGSGVVENGVVQFGFPYFPLSLLAVIPGHYLGDVRFAQIAFLVATAVLFAILQPGPLGRGISLLYLFSPRTLFLVEQSWSEPLVVFLATLTVFAARHAPLATSPLFGTLLAAKQTMVWMPFLVPLLVQGSLQRRFRFLCLAISVAATITLPFLLWDSIEFWRSVVQWQFIQPFRRDSLSIPAWAFAHFGVTLPVGWAFFASMAFLTMALWKACRTPAGWAISATLVYIVFFAMNKQAFCNYYFMVIGFACLTAASARISQGKSVLPDPEQLNQ